MGAWLHRSTPLQGALAEVFELFPILEERRRQVAETLSGGQQQMLCIGRALMARPKLIMLDEPSTGLSPKLTWAVLDAVKAIRDRGVSVLLVEQNAAQALALADRAYVLESGSVVLVRGRQPSWRPTTGSARPTWGSEGGGRPAGRPRRATERARRLGGGPALGRTCPATGPVGAAPRPAGLARRDGARCRAARAAGARRGVAPGATDRARSSAAAAPRPVEAAAWLNATAMVRLELDEGHKYAKGHPAAHGLHAVLALAADLRASGRGHRGRAGRGAYEVAARHGRATSLRPGAHPHGSWGVAGAAAGCARLLGLDAAGDRRGDRHRAPACRSPATSPRPSTATRSATPGWRRATSPGWPPRAWPPPASARCTGTAATSLGELLGTFDPDALVDGLWDGGGTSPLGYFKRHAACSFTHPAADAVLAVRDGLDPADVRVGRSSRPTPWPAGLDRTGWDSRLAALFSTPVRRGSRARARPRRGPRCPTTSAATTPGCVGSAGPVRSASRRTSTPGCPTQRAARVTVRTAAGDRVVRGAQPRRRRGAPPARRTETSRRCCPAGCPSRPRSASVRDVAAGLPGRRRRAPAAGPLAADPRRRDSTATRPPLTTPDPTAGRGVPVRLYAVTPIHVPDAELARRQARYDALSPPGLVVRAARRRAGSAARARHRAAGPRLARASSPQALRAAPDEADALLPDCVLDPGRRRRSGTSAARCSGCCAPASRWSRLAGRSFGAVTRNEAIAARARAAGPRRTACADGFRGVEVLDLRRRRHPPRPTVGGGAARRRCGADGRRGAGDLRQRLQRRRPAARRGVAGRCGWSTRRR